MKDVHGEGTGPDCGVVVAVLAQRGQGTPGPLGQLVVPPPCALPHLPPPPPLCELHQAEIAWEVLPGIPPWAGFPSCSTPNPKFSGFVEQTNPLKSEAGLENEILLAKSFPIPGK